jgi:outer membrane receptor for ferrienterochelin and colicin
MEKSKRLFAMLLFIFVSLAMFGQGATTSSMSGKVVDITGKALPGATVVATHVPSGTLYGATANSEGFFLMQGMRPGGPYKVEASFVGYSKKTYTDITLFLGETYSLNPDLTESSTELNEVVVTGIKQSAFNSVKTGATMNISSTQITSLPSISRSINDFTRLSPLSGGSNSFAGRDGRYNNINIDGSNFNNNFGLSSKNMPGGDAEPVSLDAIEEIQVNVAPFDVRQANFTGAGINAITKRGTNEFSASVYSYYRDQSFNGQKVGSYELPAATATSTKIIGARVGGPIIKDKLFFFLNGEYEKSSVPGMEWQASRKGTADSIGAPNVSRTAADSLTKFSNLLQSKYGYATGPFENYGAFAVENFKVLGRIDWNISQRHKFSLRFNAVRSTNNQIVNGTSAPNPRATSNRVSQNAMSYQNTNYGFLNTVYSLSAELNSNFSNAISNQLLGTFTMIQDTRNSPSQNFPFIDIWDGAGDAYMSAGYELFTFNNNVVNNVFTITDNVTYKTGRHNFTAGASFEYLYFGNSYMRYGTSYYRFKDLQTFVNHVNGLALNQPIGFGITYSFDPNNSKPIAELGFGQVSAYAQDEYNILDNLKLTYGIRFDMPLYMNQLLVNPAIDAMKFQNYEPLNTSSWPTTKIVPSPRIGFNWDVFKDKSLKIRGGTGIFTGRLPFVWFTNVPTNSGMLQNTVEYAGPTATAQLDSIKFNPDPFYNSDGTNWNPTTKTHDPLFPTVAGTKSPSSVAGIDKNFKMPQVWRTSLAADIKLPLDMTLTLEGMYTKDMNAIVQKNVNMPQPYGATPYNGPDKRPVWTTTGRKIYSALSEAMLLTNTNQGYSWNFTAALNFPIVKNFNGMVAYTVMMAKDISGNPGSQAASAWSGNLSVRGQNDLDMSFSQYLTPQRVVGSLNYKIDYLEHMSTSIAVFYNGYIDGNFSYKYSNDFNNDGINSDLLYIPKNQSEITFEDFIPTGSTKVKYTAAQQAAAFWAYVGQDKYLSSHLGQYAERNGAFYPWYHRFDVKILQDFYLTVKGKKNTLQLSCDILNAANLLNSGWGIRHRLSTGSGALLSSRAVSNNLLFKMVESGGALPTKTFDNVNTTSSTWGIQIGLRYIFN